VEAAQSAADAALGQGYLDGASQGRGADPRAVAALVYALAQRGDPYKWSEEGPDKFDCSGLMYAAYRTAAAGNFPLRRVSRDQYLQTQKNAVDRYSLVPGDLLFFSSSNSWRGIHHVAMYAGNGMMVEAPRTRLNVRLVPVRWSRLFQATRVYGSVEGVTKVPVPKPDNNSGGGTKSPAATSKPPSNGGSKPPSVPPSSGGSKPPSVPPSSTKPPDDPPPSSTAPPATTSPPSSGGTTPSGGSSGNGSSSGAAPGGGSSSVQSPSGAEDSKPASASGSAASGSAAADD
jgi:hypothetical protein